MSNRSTTARVFDALEERLPPVLSSVLRRLRTEDLFLLSAALAFYALVSVVPFATLVLWLVGLITGEDRVQHVADQLARVLPANLGIDNLLRRVADLGASLGLWALLGLVWPATAYGAGLRRSFDRLSKHQGEEGRGLRGRALALGLIGAVPALALAGLVASYAGTTLVGEGPLARLAGWCLALAMGFVGSAVAVTLIYRIFAPRSLEWRGILRGAVTAAGAISVVSLGYVIFLNLGADFERRYATSGLAAIVLLAFWLFAANALILVGFQVAQET